MNHFTRITIPLSRDDFYALRDAAAKEYRDPRRHAAWLLRQVLNGTDEVISEQTQSDISGLIRQDLTTNAAL